MKLFPSYRIRAFLIDNGCFFSHRDEKHDYYKHPKIESLIAIPANAEKFSIIEVKKILKTIDELNLGFSYFKIFSVLSNPISSKTDTSY